MNKSAFNKTNIFLLHCRQIKASRSFFILTKKQAPASDIGKRQVAHMWLVCDSGL